MTTLSRLSFGSLLLLLLMMTSGAPGHAYRAIGFERVVPCALLRSSSKPCLASQRYATETLAARGEFWLWSFDSCSWSRKAVLESDRAAPEAPREIRRGIGHSIRFIVGRWLFERSPFAARVRLNHFEALPIVNYVLVANHVNRFGLDGGILMWVLRIVTGRRLQFVVNPITKDLADIAEHRAAVSVGDRSTTSRVEKILCGGTYSVGFFPWIPIKGAREWHRGYAWASLHSHRPVVVAILDTNLRSRMTIGHFRTQFKKWLWTGKEFPFETFGITIADVLWPDAFRVGASEEAAVNALDARVRILLQGPGVTNLAPINVRHAAPSLEIGA